MARYRPGMHALPIGPCDGLAPFALRLSNRPGLAWLDGESAHREGRWSFLATDPVERIQVPLSSPAPLAAFDVMEPKAPERADECESSPAPHELPRWIGYVAYDACHVRGASRLARPPQQPVLSFARYDAVLALNHHQRLAYVAGDDMRSCERLLARLDVVAQPLPRARHVCLGELLATPADTHRTAIERALEHIAAGDIYQVNLARCWSASFDGPALGLWSRLRASAVPFGLYFDDTQGPAPNASPRILMSRSMERFLRWQRDTGALSTCPIKGTIARRGDRDREEAASLLADDKERAEHAMIVDLMRNDLGRVAAVGTVHVPDCMRVEAFTGLSHLVSTVACKTRAGVGLRDVLEATFPPGSVTGAPKRRAVELIEQLEHEPRDAYTGAFGFVDRCGGLSLAVAIRTAMLVGGRLRYFAGGGIVEASDPGREVAETELKAGVFLEAIGAVGRR